MSPSYASILDVSQASFKTQVESLHSHLSASTKDKTLAVLYIMNSCGSLCGNGSFHLLEKVNGRWRAVPSTGRLCLVMSWTTPAVLGHCC